MSFIERLRIWLEKYKVFFETITALLLAAMAIMVSIAQFRMMEKQNEISIANGIPQILATISFEKDRQGNYSDEWQVVENEGGVIKQARTFEAMFIKVAYSSSRPARIQTLNIPLSGYYNTEFLTGRGKGTIAKSWGKGSNKKFNDFSNEFKPLMANNNEILLVSLVRMLKILYLDIFGQQRTEYLVVDPLGGSSTVSKPEGDRIFTAYDTALDSAKYLDFSKLNAAEFHANIAAGKYDTWDISLKEVKQ